MFDERIHVVPEHKTPHNRLGIKQRAGLQPYDKYYISCDYGTMNPSAFILWGLAGGVWYALDEYYYDGRKNTPRTDEEHYAELKRLAGKLPIERVIIDPSAASFVTLINRKGEFRAKSADNDVINGIRETGTALKLGMLRFSSKCKHAIAEFGLYSWNDKKSEDEVIKENDHCMDAVRYFVKTLKLAEPKRRRLYDH